MIRRPELSCLQQEYERSKTNQLSTFEKAMSTKPATMQGISMAVDALPE
jgi:hypothetical protein